jgi:D-lactate dehydrogenase
LVFDSLVGYFCTGTSMLIEDVACPVDKLADMTVDLGEMFQRHGYHEASCFGHALEGNLHLVFSQVSVF